MLLLVPSQLKAKGKTQTAQILFLLTVYQCTEQHYTLGLTNIQAVIYSIDQPEIECNTIQGDQSKPGHSQTQILKENII